jgi:hypothetical protein
LRSFLYVIPVSGRSTRSLTVTKVPSVSMTLKCVSAQNAQLSPETRFVFVETGSRAEIARGPHVPSPPIHRIARRELGAPAAGSVCDQIVSCGKDAGSVAPACASRSTPKLSMSVIESTTTLLKVCFALTLTPRNSWFGHGELRNEKFAKGVDQFARNRDSNQAPFALQVCAERAVVSRDAVRLREDLVRVAEIGA